MLKQVYDLRYFRRVLRVRKHTKGAQIGCAPNCSAVFGFPVLESE